jgi:hypothetical protein
MARLPAGTYAQGDPVNLNYKVRDFWWPNIVYMFYTLTRNHVVHFNV